jgi:hypothetical protein
MNGRYYIKIWHGSTVGFSNAIFYGSKDRCRRYIRRHYLPDMTLPHLYEDCAAYRVFSSYSHKPVAI